jgi:hypothetical protein
MKKIRPITPSDSLHIDGAVEALRSARRLLRKAGATNAADYVCRALKSADGASRHARRVLAQQRSEAWAAATAAQDRPQDPPLFPDPS